MYINIFIYINYKQVMYQYLIFYYLATKLIFWLQDLESHNFEPEGFLPIIWSKPTYFFALRLKTKEALPQSVMEPALEPAPELPLRFSVCHTALQADLEHGLELSMLSEFRFEQSDKQHWKNLKTAAFTASLQGKIAFFKTLLYWKKRRGIIMGTIFQG